jgi:hypothetical protein
MSQYTPAMPFPKASNSSGEKYRETLAWVPCRVPA